MFKTVFSRTPYVVGWFPWWIFDIGGKPIGDCLHRKGGKISLPVNSNVNGKADGRQTKISRRWRQNIAAEFRPKRSFVISIRLLGPISVQEARCQIFPLQQTFACCNRFRECNLGVMPQENVAESFAKRGNNI